MRLTMRRYRFARLEIAEAFDSLPASWKQGVGGGSKQKENTLWKTNTNQS
jgi:hypothetical protein